MEREYVRCLDRSDWLTLAFTAFSFHKLDSNIILRKSGPPKLFQPGRETRLQDCWWTKDHQVSFTLWCFYEILNGNLLWLKISIMYECPWSSFLERQSFHHYWRRDMTKKQNQCSTHSFTKQLRQWCFEWVEEGFTMTTIKTMMFQMGGGGFTMTTMQSFSRFINAFLVVRHENQMAMNL